MGRLAHDSGLKKGPWTIEEDKLLVEYIKSHGPGNWKTLPKSSGLKRCGKSCRLRWCNYLRPDIKRGNFSEEEQKLIIQLHSTLGNKWSVIASHMNGRTDNEIKNYWNTHLKKKLFQLGIDPVTHQPRSDLTLMASVSNLLGLGNTNSTIIGMSDHALHHTDHHATQLAKIQLIHSLIRMVATSEITHSNFTCNPPKQSPLPLLHENSHAGAGALLDTNLPGNHHSGQLVFPESSSTISQSPNASTSANPNNNNQGKEPCDVSINTSISDTEDWEGLMMNLDDLDVDYNWN